MIRPPRPPEFEWNQETSSALPVRQRLGLQRLATGVDTLHFSQRLSATRERWSRRLMTYCASYSKAHDLTIALGAICDELAAGLGGSAPDITFLFVSHTHKY